MDKKVYCRNCLNLKLDTKTNKIQCFYLENILDTGEDWYGKSVIFGQHPSKTNKYNNCKWFQGGGL